MTTKDKHQISPPGGWRILDSTRLHPMPLNEAGLVTRLKLFLFKRFFKLDIANIHLLMRHNPRLHRGVSALTAKLMPYGELERKDTEIVILRVAWNCRSYYEWGQHVEIGLHAGLTTDDIANVSQGHEAPGWNAKQASLLKACDEFHHERLISGDTWHQLATHFDKKLLLELLFLIGFYEGLAGVLNSTGIPLDAEVEKNLAVLSFQEK